MTLSHMDDARLFFLGSKLVMTQRLTRWERLRRWIWRALVGRDAPRIVSEVVAVDKEAGTLTVAERLPPPRLTPY